jgi:hypothetical protein
MARMVKRCLQGLLIAGLGASSLGGCAVSRPAGQTEGPEQKLHSIVIPNERLSGSPKEIVAQLNKLSRKYDAADHTGVRIVFDTAVDAESCTLGIFCRGEPLANWVQQVCGSCGSRYRVETNRVVIELLPLSEKRTPELERHLTNGIVELSREFRARRGQDRFALGQQIYRLLPRSPITWQKEAPMHLYTSYDYEHPSYTLYKRDVLLLLGEPDRNINNELFRYALSPGGLDSSELQVEFGKYDYAINPGMHWK